MPQRDNIIISDTHGCIDEFNEMLRVIEYDSTKHRLILVGDILDRGSDPIGLLHQIQDMEIECVLGNHEQKALRWRNHEGLRELTGVDNPVKPPSEKRRKEWEQLTAYDLQWIANLPLFIHVKDNWYVLHAGVEPSKPFKDQNLSDIIRIRYVDKNGNYVKPKNKEQPPGTKFWAECWNRPTNIVFGHQRFDQPTIFTNSNNICVGIDTGCCFGNALTAYNIDKNKFYTVKAHKAHFAK